MIRALALLLLVLPGLQEDAVAKLIERLDAESVEARDEAEAGLLKLGEAALPQLRKAMESGKPEIRDRARRLVAKLEPRVPEAELLKLAAALEDLVLKAKDETGLAGELRTLLRDFSERHAPKEKTEVFKTRDAKTLAIALGAPGAKGQDAPATFLEFEARWTIAVGGHGEVLKGDGLPKGGQDVEIGAAGTATARSATGIAIALGGDGSLMKTPTGVAGGGSGGDATASSPVFGLALPGKDRTGSIDPPMDGEAKGAGDVKAAQAWLRKAR